MGKFFICATIAIELKNNILSSIVVLTPNGHVFIFSTIAIEFKNNIFELNRSINPKWALFCAIL
jgi:hypothetical protein